MAARAASHSWPAGSDRAPEKTGRVEDRRERKRPRRQQSQGSGYLFGMVARGRGGYRDGMGGTRDVVEGSEVRQGSCAEKVVRQIRQVGEPEPQNRDVGGGQDWSGRKAPGSGSGMLVGGGMWGRWPLGGGCAVCCASKEADRGTCERKYKVGSNVYLNTKSEYKI